MDWRVVVQLMPPQFRLGESFSFDVDDLRVGWEAIVADAAGRSDAESWSDASRDGFMADLKRQELDAGGGECGWTTSNSPAYELELAISGPTAAAAESEALTRVGEIQEWEIEATAEPLVPLPRGFYVG